MIKKLLIILSLFFLDISANSLEGYVIYNGDVNDNKIYLTFDDGYSQKNTISILDTLKKYNIGATFFIEGGFLKENPNVCKRIADEQILANHTMCHCDITKLSNQNFIDDINEFEQTALEITGQNIRKFFRPPMGFIDKEKAQILKQRGYLIFKWNVQIYDYVHYDDQGVDYVVKNITNQVKPGSIILMHTLTDSNAKALPILIEKLQAQGYEFSSLMDFLAR
ncbi:TPA: polysaccharide deacetylase family protein [Candidatus Avacholeplasma faecigallinarum]|nr:polysaccharide deacetylase family protein [Candidatus Avacholeplasma faecigallinarum]